MTNAYHQVPLADYTSKMLSIQTPWGVFRPLFMREGVAPASAKLQMIVNRVFSDLGDWVLAIFDNILLACADYQDAYNKTEIFLKRCLERNIIIKLSKSFLGFDSTEDFRYIVGNGKYYLDDKRKLAIQSIPFPTNTKKMLSFLESALYFQPFVEKFAEKAAPLYEMTKKDFNWEPKTFAKDYARDFQVMKDNLNDAVVLFYPDYTLTFLLRGDASDIGIGGGLYQLRVTNNTIEEQPLGLYSAKVSDPALKWHTIVKEAYAIFALVKNFEYYLRGVEFVIETDHRNLIWIEKSVEPKIVRWRLYLQSFKFTITHIPGKDNVVADTLSRLFAIYEYNLSDASVLNDLTVSEPDNIEELFNSVHGGRAGHNGVTRTWGLMNKHYPGHNVPFRVVQQMVADCAICLKFRLDLNQSLEGVTRNVVPPDDVRVLGADTLTITPDVYRNSLVNVIVNQKNKAI